MSTLPNLVLVFPEIFVLSMALLILVFGNFLNCPQVPYYLTQSTLIGTFWLIWYIFPENKISATLLTFHHMFVLDYVSFYLKLCICLVSFCAFFYVREYNQTYKIRNAEFYVFGLLSLLGMMILVSSHNLLITFLGMELSFLPTCIMSIMTQRPQIRCVESGIKYFVTGIVASGILAYGMSMVFGATQSLDFSKIATAVNQIPACKSTILIFGLVFIVAALAFKLGVVPFHMWIPDIYEGAPSSSVVFISTAPKIAAFSVIVRLLVNTLSSLQGSWRQMLMVMAVLSMGIGNFTAILQSNVKRMLAYSSIAHMGYVLLGIACGTKEGYTAAMFYAVTYSFTTLSSFGMIILMSLECLEEQDDIGYFTGLNDRNSWLAFMMTLTLFSLAGIPPSVGFIAKVGILDALIRVHLVWLAILSVFFTVVGAYYCIRIVKAMYFESPTLTYRPIQCPLRVKIVFSINSLAVFLIGVFPEWLYTLTHLAF
ncbi:NADH-quinone oxidoreductase subunit NuoN [Coxiella endosymbiont of Amblyomma sculptum]|uniref:NADH-quinone oxidoreductase subunit NuoN n=1 Tax=Coxiella endosymbiont of Amblyomma sculptum TaxID=2487929 RepID=UPI00132EBCC4|nr:NADH-quinone oxidoreductase subunit NuoN [Coxiella endosymbiont of Amblyomma sculptum]QHG92322.1 NADH-quinone oxidoreductase subunit NuoN [Coxiella endosymbiont of Amblyomma sculptum]